MGQWHSQNQHFQHYWLEVFGQGLKGNQLTDLVMETDIGKVTICYSDLTPNGCRVTLTTVVIDDLSSIKARLTSKTRKYNEQQHPCKSNFFSSIILFNETITLSLEDASHLGTITTALKLSF